MLDQFVGPKLPESDAREGALSRLTAAGRAIPETIAEGARVGAAALAGLQLPQPQVAAPTETGGATVDLSEVAALLRSQNLVLRSIERLLEGGGDPDSRNSARGVELLGQLLLTTEAAG